MYHGAAAAGDRSALVHSTDPRSRPRSALRAKGVTSPRDTGAPSGLFFTETITAKLNSAPRLIIVCPRPMEGQELFVLRELNPMQGTLHQLDLLNKIAFAVCLTSKNGSALTKGP